MANTIQFHISLMYELCKQDCMTEEQRDNIVEQIIMNPQNFD